MQRRFHRSLLHREPVVVAEMPRPSKNEERPPLTSTLSEDEFRRWYWTLAELQPFARELGVSATGLKPDVADRIAAKLGGRPQPPRVVRKPSGPQLTGELTRDTVIPVGQKSTRELRRFFETEIGPGFRYNGHMRAFLAAGNATLGDAVDHWHATKKLPLPKQSDSLEFNRFTKAWHTANPNGTIAESRKAWADYRALPVDKRPPIE